ncbi:hypothetical protein FHL15_008365 [Xylaria flabelliformis]|uniref:ribonuclease H n=1 Tax=Xylaria flabelliformis TaxID=2512241 RepID=A0A553HS69_9PEZI|nr:hypothetical protein FHL15_008365 [Xylaria flabelliformis]
MSVLSDIKPLVAYDAREGPVCFDHRRQVCDTCCMRYPGTGRFPEFDGDERVFILEPVVNRFMPQWDHLLSGLYNTYMIAKNRADPPEALTQDQISLHYCDECQITWIEGDAGVEAVQSHPSHRTTSFHAQYGTDRSLIVFTDGACPSNGMSSAVNSSIGVYFGPQSKYNISERLNNDDTPTNQVAEITAALKALQQVLRNVEPARRTLIRGSFPRIGKDRFIGIKRFRLIVATDSSYVVECMSKHIEKWSMVDGIYRNEQGGAVKNSDGFAKLTHAVKELSMVGVQVAWYHVPRQFNKEADGLARSALQS